MFQFQVYDKDANFNIINCKLDVMNKTKISLKTNTLSKSKSKQKYSFCKAPRFVAQKKQTALCYSGSTTELNNYKKSQTFGKSKRLSPFHIQSHSPVAKYNLKSCFEKHEMNRSKSLLNRSGLGFGQGRQSLKTSNFSYINNQKISNPGPGSYEVQTKNVTINLVPGGHIGIKTKKKNQLFSTELVADNVPGPGKYNQNINNKSLKGGKITTLSIRFDQSKQNYPGPGSYLKTYNSKQGKDYMTLSCKPCSLEKSKNFGSSSRITYFDNQIRQSRAPGPGKYQVSSEFC